METENFTEDDVVYAYTRKQAIEDGQLIDVSSVAREAGIIIPVAVTNNLWAKYIEPSEQAQHYGQSVQGRLWDVLWMLRIAAKKTGGSHIEYQVIFQDGPKRQDLHKPTLWAICDGGDDGQPVITVMLPEDY